MLQMTDSKNADDGLEYLGTRNVDASHCWNSFNLLKCELRPLC